MILGMTPFTFVHVLISLIGILSGLIILFGLISDNLMPGWTALFLLTTAATSITGFLFSFHGFTPGIGVGIISLLVLTPAMLARYVFRLGGAWRAVYVVGAVAALYLNCFVFVVQAFQKIPPLHALAPRGSEPPFAIVQGVVLITFVAAGFLALRRFHPTTSVLA